MLKRNSLDILTISSIGIVSWVLFATLHEIIGHGVVAAIFGEEFKGAVSTTVHIVDFYKLDNVVERIGWWGFRTVAAGGSIFNFITAAIALILLANSKIKNPSFRYFLWLFSSISIFQQALWLAIMPFAAIGGDWTAFFIEINNPILWKLFVSTIGLILLWIGIYIPMKLWSPKLSSISKLRDNQIMLLTGLPILVAIIVQSLSVLWSPLSGPRYTSIVTIFSFIPVVIWFVILLQAKTWDVKDSDTTELKIDFSYKWLTFGVLAFIFFVFLLGPGIGSFEGHPNYL